MVDLEELRVFLTVVELGSFTKASIRLGSTQSGISRRVQRLEEELKTRLLYRNGRGVTLTEAGIRGGEAMSEDVFQLIDETREELSAAGKSLRGAITLGLPPSLGASLSMPLARRFREAHPEGAAAYRRGFQRNLVGVAGRRAGRFGCALRCASIPDDSDKAPARGDAVPHRTGDRPGPRQLRHRSRSG